MTTQLDMLLDDIDPHRVLEQTAARVDEAINSFPMSAAQIMDREQFKRLLTQFVVHIESRGLALSAPVKHHREMAWGKCVRILMNKYGPHGEQTAFDMARTGNAGGLYDVLKKIGWYISENVATQEMDARIHNYWNNLTVAQWLAATDEYLSKFGHLLPSELTENGAARLRVNMIAVLREHPRLMQSLGQIGRS